MFQVKRLHNITYFYYLLYKKKEKTSLKKVVTRLP
jgi:hypothetical protein